MTGARPTPNGAVDRERCDLIRFQNKCIVGAFCVLLLLGTAVWGVAYLIHKGVLS